MNGNGNIMGMRGIRVGMRRIRVRMQGIRVIFVRIFVIIASAKLPAREGRISPSSCYWQLPNYQSHVFCLAYQADEFSFKEMRTWGHSKISYSCVCVWCESGELGCNRSSIFPCVTPVVETFSSDKATFRIPSNINDGAPLRKQPTALTRRLFPQKNSTAGLRSDSKCGSDWRRCECGVWVDCQCMKFTTTTMYTIILIVKIIIITIIQFLLHIHKKNLFLLPTATEVAFNATILYPSLQDFVFQQSICRCVIPLNHRTTVFSLLNHTTLWQPLFFPQYISLFQACTTSFHLTRQVHHTLSPQFCRVITRPPYDHSISCSTGHPSMKP